MSANLKLSGNNLDLDEWNTVIEEWSAGREGELFGEPQFEPRDGRPPTVFVRGRGSIRGFFVSLEDAYVDVEIPGLASPADWKRSYSLLKAAIEAGGGHLVHDEGQSYGVEDLTQERAEADSVRYTELMLSAVRSRYEKGASSLSLPTPHFDLRITPSDVSGENGEIIGTLASRFERYETAFRPSMLFSQGDKQGVAWALIDSILPKVDWVTIPGEDPNAHCHVEWADVCELLGDKLENVGGNRFFFPGADHLGPELVSSLRGRGETSQAGNEGKDLESRAGGVLLQAPFAVGIAVAQADGKADEAELQAACGFMTEYVSEGRNKVVKALLAGSIATAQQILKQRAGEDLVQVLVRTSETVNETLDERDRDDYIDFLVRLMQNTARASGGFFGFGDKISKKERKVIATVEALLLGLDPS